MVRTALLLLSVVAPALADFSLRRVNLLAAGLYDAVDGKVLCRDSDHNGRRELLFSTGTINPGNPLRWEIWEYRPVNRYELVFADTGAYPYPPGIVTGNLIPFDIGDVDQDGRTDIVGVNWERANDTLYNVLVVMESPNEHSLPDSLVWTYRFGRYVTGSSPCYVTTDLDKDGNREIVLLGAGQYIGLGIWEPSGDNQYDLVWNSWDVPSMTSLMFGDFDRDSLREFAGGWSLAAVYENIAPGKDSYVIVYCDTTGLGNGNDGFSAQDLDQDGWPEFLISFHSYSANTFFLNMWEATGNNTFERTLVDQRRMVVGHGGGRSRCGDLDGDGVDELAWALPLGLFLYKAVGNDEFEQV
ncbi:MAG: VCBS repeat-containing protein, partial [candidate division WOR-3 bacterium]